MTKKSIDNRQIIKIKILKKYLPRTIDVMIKNFANIDTQT